jgi:osmotically-inducible protein OsmY
MGKSNDIRAAAIDDLTFDPDVDASDIGIEEMDVALTGNVPSYPQYVQAAAVAARAAGVRCVRNHLRSRWRPAITATT